MIDNRVFELVNSNESVAIVGSGVSTDAGVLGWKPLVRRLTTSLESSGVQVAQARALADKNRLPEALDALAKETSRETIHKATAQVIEESRNPSDHHKKLSQWLFRFIVTTNYDHLIEDASNNQLTPVGNRGQELPKMSSGVRDVVWHLHGSSRLPSDLSQMIVTKADYDDYYPNSNAIQSLKAITQAFRCVFVGFGFQDLDFLYALKAVGRLAHKGRPSFAFLGYKESDSNVKDRFREIRDLYNVEVIPYQIIDDRHSDLHRVLEAYDPFMLRRSFGVAPRSGATPEYSPPVTSLRVQSALNISESGERNIEIQERLVGSRILAFIRENGPTPLERIVTECQTHDIDIGRVNAGVSSLRRLELISDSDPLSLTSTYQSREVESDSLLSLSKDRFLGSIRFRALQIDPQLDTKSQDRIVRVLSDFLSALSRTNGLGVAQNLATTDGEQAALRTVALLHDLPEYVGTLSNRNEEFIAVEITAGILTHPNEAESAYLGMLCQGYFGQHLLGVDTILREFDLGAVEGTCYLVDASVLVGLLAEGGRVHAFTSEFVNDIGRAGALLYTTDLLLDELAEHANWARKTVNRFGEESADLLDVLRCLRGYKPNQFLQGYFFGDGKDHGFLAYLGRVLDCDVSRKITAHSVSNKLKAFRIEVLQFEDWVGFEGTLYAARDQSEAEITRRRGERKSYKHPRQVKAEAEVAILVGGLREKRLRPPGREARNAFFLSSTRVVDGLPNLPRRISLLPEGLARWLWSSRPISSKHAGFVFEQLLWELAEQDIEFVDKQTLLRRFSGVVEATKLEMTSALRDREEYLVTKYGADPEKAFSDVDPLDMPHYSAEATKEVIQRMEQALKQSRERESRSDKKAQLSTKELAQVAKFRKKQEAKKAKAKRNDRARQSSKGRKKKR